MRAVWKREWNALFTGLGGWLYLSLFLLSGGALTAYYNINQGATGVGPVFQGLCMLLIPAAALLTMDLFSKERAGCTDRLLRALPIRPGGAALGKLFSLLSLHALTSLALAALPVLVYALGGDDWLSGLCAAWGFFVLGAVLLSVSAFLSSISPGAPGALLISLIALFALGLAARMPGVLGGLLYQISPYSRFNLALNGVLDWGALCKDLATIALMAVLTVQLGGARRVSA